MRHSDHSKKSHWNRQSTIDWKQTLAIFSQSKKIMMSSKTLRNRPCKQEITQQESHHTEILTLLGDQAQERG